jgi:hypothetical protein
MNLQKPKSFNMSRFKYIFFLLLAASTMTMACKKNSAQDASTNVEDKGPVDPYANIPNLKEDWIAKTCDLLVIEEIGKLIPGFNVADAKKTPSSTGGYCNVQWMKSNWADIDRYNQANPKTPKSPISLVALNVYSFQTASMNGKLYQMAKEQEMPRMDTTEPIRKFFDKSIEGVGSEGLWSSEKSKIMFMNANYRVELQVNAVDDPAQNIEIAKKIGEAIMAKMK